MPKIKILHVFHSFNMGGLENGVVNLINQSNPDNFQHEICCFTTTGVAEKRLEKKIPLFEMHKREGNDLKMIWRLIKLMKKRQPHIVHTRNWGGIDAIVAAKMAAVPRIIHGEHGWNLDDPLGQNLKRRRIRRFLSPLVNHFVAVSADIQNWLIQDVGIKKEKISVILNGVDTEKFRPREQTDLRQSLGFLASECIIGCVGRFDPVKNHRLLIKAFSKLNYTLRPMRLVFLGDGPERASLEALGNELHCHDRIHFLGERDDVADILRMMDIFVLPSKSEGICNALLEAMATGLPIVATAVGGNTELIQDGSTGLLIPSDDEDAMASALNSFLNDSPDRREQIEQNARKRAEKEFSLRCMIEAYESLYASLT